MIVFTVTAMMKSSVCKLVKIVDMSCPTIEFTQNMIEKIIRTEIIIERNHGKEISSDLWIEALNTIGIRTKMIKPAEMPKATRFAKEMIRLRQWKGVTEAIISQVNAVKVEKWNSLDTVSRAAIASFYGITEHPGYDCYITPSNSIRKFKCRKAILQFLETPYVSTA